MEDLFDEDNSAGRKKTKPTTTRYQNQTHCYSNHAENIFSPITMWGWSARDWLIALPNLSVGKSASQG